VWQCETTSGKKGSGHVSATKWGKKRLRGVEYDLSHLDPFLFEAIPGDANAPRLRVVASFNSHAFTRKREPDDTPDFFLGTTGTREASAPYVMLVPYTCPL